MNMRSPCETSLQKDGAVVCAKETKYSAQRKAF
jgi:hypothetical protein